LRYRRDGDRTTAHDRHEGPLRVLQRLYPEGPGICHHVLVHPPGGLVGGDRVEVDATLGPDSHAVLTTPGATRFYRSAGASAQQSVCARLEPGARLEWLPMETLAYDGCLADNALRFELAPGAEMIGWDVLALGLPAADQPFRRGQVQLRLELPGVWLERGTLAADDTLLRRSPLGWDGHDTLATLWFGAGSAITTGRRDALVDAARALTDATGLVCGTSALHPQVIVLRALGGPVEPLMQWLIAVRAAWRRAAWDLAAAPPRIWQT
jgi:urease accessory protein